MMNARRIASTLLLACLASACDGGAADPDIAQAPDAPPAPTPTPDAAPRPSPTPDAAPSPTPTPDAAPPAQTCSPWTVHLDATRPPAATATARTEGGQLVLTSDHARDGQCSSDVEPCADIALTRGVLSGDFDVSVDVANVTGSNLFDRLDLFVEQGNQYYMPYHLIAVADGSLFYEGYAGTSHDSWSAGASTSAGTLRIQRTGDRIALTAEFGATKLERKDIYVSGDVTLGLALELGAPPSPSDLVTARIDGVTITGGGGAIASDSFDDACDLTPGA